MNINITISALEARLWQDVVKKYRKSIKARKESLSNDMILQAIDSLVNKLDPNNATTGGGA